MELVRELVDRFPMTHAPRVLRRREDLLLSGPLPGPFPLARDQAPVEAVHFAPEYRAQKFAPPRGVYESDRLRVEWQTMDNRQPFYHRNCDVDELSYQIWGDRTLMTELGSVELGPGDLSRIPQGVAHDNYGRRESHLLFYLPGPVEELAGPVRRSEATFPPFPGWEAATVNEVVTDSLGGPGSMPAACPVDERLLLEQALTESERIAVLRPGGAAATTWLYRSAQVMIGHTLIAESDGRDYQRHLDADEIQYQVSGHRALVTQRGVLQLEPGDFVRIPTGVAYASIAAAPSAHLTLVTTAPIPQVAASSKKAEQLTPAQLDELRRG